MIVIMRTVIFNKPYGVLSQFTDEGTGHSTLKDYIQVPNIYAAGRLDRDSEGLLLLTDDGALIKRLTDPKHHIEKTYLVLVEGDPTPEKLKQLSSGVALMILHHALRPLPQWPGGGVAVRCAPSAARAPA